MIRLFQPLLILLSALLATVKAEKTNYMINPVYINGKSPVWTLGDQKVVAWKTDLPVFNVSIWQQSPLGGGAYTRGNVYAQVHEKDHVSNFTWTVQLYGFDLDYSPTFFFWINPGPGGFPSAYFNITERSSTAKTTPSIPVNSTLASSFPSSDTTVSPTDQPPALTTTAKLALGLGVGIGVPILVAMATLVWLRVRRLRATRQAAASMAVPRGTEMQQRQPHMHVREIRGTDPTEFCQELPQDTAGKPLRPELPDQRYD